MSHSDVVDQFHRFYYESGVWRNTFWLGISTQKCPLDLWIYQEIIFELRPDLIVECGTADGGSALYLASLCDLVQHGKVVTIDVEDRPGRPKHKRITYVLGSSTTRETSDRLSRLTRGLGRTLVILDSDHSKAHVLEELRIYSKLVTVESYLIVEDTNVNSHPVLPEFGPGPMEAVDDFLKENREFVIDRSRERLYLTFNPRGYLKRVR